MPPEDFHKLARQCSGKDTVHFRYSMNWMLKVYGSCFIDYILFMENGDKYMDTLFNEANKLILATYKLLGFEKILLDELIDDPRNIIDYMLYYRQKDKWIEYFFLKPI